MAVSFLTVRPIDGEFAPYYGKYIEKVSDGNILDTLALQNKESVEFFMRLSDQQAMHRYQPDKWTIKDVVGHLTDSERVFAYRSMRVSRADTTPMPGFDENTYVANANFADRKLSDLAQEFARVRQTTLDLFRSFGETVWTRKGTANNNDVTVRALAWIIAGHELHHQMIVKTRYVPQA